ncbi:MAG: aminopeptidase, partial [Solirubrobacteraceae bacterium]|nr:aminopeptidase [Solirubrobacteraceae bacterium]
MLDPAKFADLLTGYCLDVQPGQQVLVRSTTLAAPLLLELQRAILQRDAWPLLRPELPGSGRVYYEYARDRQLDEPPDVSYYESRKAQAHLGIQAPEDTRALADIDPEVIQRAALGRQPIREITLRKRWCSTLWPTEALAEQAGMSLPDYEEFVARALFINQVDPVRSWGELHDFHERLIGRLAKAREIRIESDGTDITMKVKGRTWVNSDGKRNMP